MEGIWRLFIENKVRERKNGNGRHGQLTPDNRDAKKTIIKMKFDPSLVTGQLLL